jgi:hypothetical protein
MNTIEKTRTIFRKRPILGWLAAGVLLLSALLLLYAVLKSGPTVTGTVRVDGEPLSTGSIRFVPVDGTGSDAGANIREGKYRISKGLAVGKYKVEIQSTLPVPGKWMRDPVFGTLIPAEEKFVFAEPEPIIREVGPGRNPLDFDLKEARKRR